MGLGSCIGFLGLGFSVDGVWGLWFGAFWVFLGWGSLYEHKRITLGKKMVDHYLIKRVKPAIIYLYEPHTRNWVLRHPSTVLTSPRWSSG